MKYILGCCSRIVDVDNKPKWCIRCGEHNIKVEEYTENYMRGCPFCGQSPQAEAMDTIGIYWYECEGCGASSGSAQDWTQAKRLWNERISDRMG